jgi:hypothetical protein
VRAGSAATIIRDLFNFEYLTWNTTRHDTQLLSSACSIRALLALAQRWCPELQYLQFNAVAVSPPFDPAAHHVNEGQVPKKKPAQALACPNH